MDLVVKSVVNKSVLKVYLIQNIDRKFLDDMASAKGLQMRDLLTEIESIVGLEPELTSTIISMK